MSNVLNCDAHGCGHVEPVDGINEGDIGRLCPKCGANLLTREDFDYWVANVEPLIKIMEDAGMIRTGDEPSDSEERFSFGYHAGTTTIVSKAK